MVSKYMKWVKVSQDDLIRWEQHIPTVVMMGYIHIHLSNNVKTV